MKTIFKYEIDLTPYQLLKLPEGFKPLSVQMQNDRIMLWAEVDTGAPVKQFPFWMFGTGHEIPPVGVGDYIGTVQMGNFVWHLYIATDAL